MTANSRVRLGAPAVERNHWFDYKYIAADDLVAEQEYLISRHRAHNRLLHGCGVVCGLEVERHPRAACEAGWVVVGAGIAIDAFGRELILADDAPKHLPVAAGDGGSFIIALRYREEGVRPVPILYADPGARPRASEPNRIREGVEIVVVPADQFDPADWAVGAAGCIAPDPSASDGRVPLAIAEIDPGGAPVTISNRPRRVGLPPEVPARIVGVSWEHGDSVPIDTLRDDRRLRITFDRRLAPSEGRARGVGPDTFCLTRERHDGPSRPVPSAGAPTLTDDGETAVFELARHALSREHEAYLGGSLVRVTLRCDFILDTFGVPVSGRHLGGRLPTGDRGVGGTFESWFQVTDRAGPGSGRTTETREATEEERQT